MLSRIAVRRCFSSTTINPYKVSVLGACGGIGQPLSLLLKLNEKVTGLNLYDLKNAKGVATDLSHIPTNSTVRGFNADEPDALHNALKDSDVVVIPAGVPRKPGMTRDDLFNVNAGIVHDLAKATAEAAPDACVLVISNPVNSTVPIVAEVFKKAGSYNPKKLFGVTTLDSIRSARFLSELTNTDPTKNSRISIIGGHSGVTILPLLSQDKLASTKLTKEQKETLIHRVQFGGDEVVKAKNGAGSATLSMAQAGAQFTDAVLRGLSGEANIVEPTFVESPIFKHEGIEFFAQLVRLGPKGVEEILPIGELSSEEKVLLDQCKEALKKNINKGKDFVNARD
ncbi:malate dehydrogenase MDH1 PWA37_003860 [Arxiozyma heterogenica]|uniref:malate dehydrogenase MDH1 n=1 Tax=Arxiozyma heterogenica TaxID=278026 RepID=UPI002F11481E